MCGFASSKVLWREGGYEWRYYMCVCVCVCVCVCQHKHSIGLILASLLLTLKYMLEPCRLKASRTLFILVGYLVGLSNFRLNIVLYIQ